MTVAERMARCRLIEKIEKNEAYAKRLGIADISTFREKNNLYVEIKK